ncbi:hypothetical protein NDU88_002054 [Pleurodeles waltl]|uniref:Uncharacterized protein n=1 Tax=Pleurodeles waltl TaxID=8319 RepID=A0AAV7MQ99_PLEWA|nr:hypothetical protein NDU88_002054 [Pleurodeles waltl]
MSFLVCPRYPMEQSIKSSYVMPDTGINILLSGEFRLHYSLWKTGRWKITKYVRNQTTNGYMVAVVRYFSVQSEDIPLASVRPRGRVRIVYVISVMSQTQNEFCSYQDTSFEARRQAASPTRGRSVVGCQDTYVDASGRAASSTRLECRLPGDTPKELHDIPETFCCM